MFEQSSEPEILFDDDVFYRIKQILKEAKPAEDVFLVTPYIRLDTRIKDAFDEAIDHKVIVTIFIRADADHPIDDINWLLRKRITVRKVDKLHAKLYLGESIGLVTSMNLHSFSGNESKEVGVCFKDALSLKKLNDRVKKWFEQSSEVDPISAGTVPKPQEKTRILSSSSDQSRSAVKSSPQKGYCISCKEQIPLNGERPLCDTHFDSLRNKLQDYKGHYCHCCGQKHPGDHYHPLCRDCWEKMGKPKYIPQAKR